MRWNEDKFFLLFFIHCRWRCRYITTFWTSVIFVLREIQISIHCIENRRGNHNRNGSTIRRCKLTLSTVYIVRLRLRLFLQWIGSTSMTLNPICFFGWISTKTRTHFSKMHTDHVLAVSRGRGLPTWRGVCIQADHPCRQTSLVMWLVMHAGKRQTSLWTDRHE